MSDKYDKLKDFLISPYGLQDCQRAQKLFAIDTLGDRLPSELMDAMLRINGRNDPNHYLFKHLFLRALPPAVRQGLARLLELDVYSLAKEADRIYLNTSELNPELAIVKSEGEPSVEPEVYRISRGPQRRGSKWQEDRNRLPRSQNECYNHRTFGDKALRCRSPCSWRQGNAKPGARRF